MISTALQSFNEGREKDHTIWFYAGAFVFWKGNTAATATEDWDRCEIQGHGHFPTVTIRVGETKGLLHPKAYAVNQIKEIARLLDAAFKEGRKYQADEIRKAIHWNGSV